MRPTWQEYFIKIAVASASRSTCERRKVGAVLVKNQDILATGYNGAPSGLEHCATRGCMREKMGIPSGRQLDICLAIHAEQNVIIQAARHGSNIAGSDLYCTNSPCLTCAKMIVNAGISRVFYIEKYNDDIALSILAEAGITAAQIKE